jgi:hypothetical protein
MEQIAYTPPVGDWIVLAYTSTDQPFYPFLVVGYLRDEKERFSWRVPSIDSPRYDLTRAVRCETADAAFRTADAAVPAEVTR